MTDLMQRLAQARPTDAELDPMWPADRRAEAWDRIRAEYDGGLAPRRTKRRARWLVAAGSAAALVACTSLLGGSPASARAQLLELAVVAAENGGPVIEEGTFLHVKTESVQRNSRIFGDGATYDTNRESWVRWDGKMWAVDTRPSAGWTDYQVFAPSDELGDPTPELVSTLPTEPAELRAYLDEHVQGSSSHEEAVFVAVYDLVQSHFLDSERLAAVLTVLADVDGVATEEVVVDGRDAVEVTFTEIWGVLKGTQSFTVDKATAQLIASNKVDPGGTYDSRTVLVEVVDEVPSDVLEVIDRHGQGARLCEDGTPADEEEGTCP